MQYVFSKAQNESKPAPPTPTPTTLDPIERSTGCLEQGSENLISFIHEGVWSS